MSDRLYEIINQCFIGTTEGKLSDLNTIRNVERFAEMIVRECASIADHPNDKVMLEHFGVEK